MLIDSIVTGDSLSPVEKKRLHFVTTWMQSSKIKHYYRENDGEI